MAAITLRSPIPRRRVGLHHLHGLTYQWQALIVVIVGSFMVMLDTTIVNIALPRIITVFQASIDSAQLVLTGYMVALAVVMPATGYLTDTFGTKRVYLLSIFAFTLGSAMCGLSWNVPSLTFFRVIQGLGGGMLMPLGMTILFKAVPYEERGLITGVFGLPLLVAPVIGPTLGGYLVEYVDWRVIFTLNIPVGILGLFLGTTLLRETERLPNLSFDIKGFLLSASGFSALLYGLTRAPEDGWGSLKVVLFLSGGALLLVFWLIVELTEEQPLLELRVFRNTTYALATGVNFVVTAGLFSSVFLLPLFLQNFRGLGAMESGLLMFPQAVASGLMMPLSGRLYDRIGPRPLIVTGLLLMAFATYRLSFLDLTTPDSEIRKILILRGFAMGLVMMPVMTTAMNTLPGPLIARGSSLTNVMRQVFGAFGTAIFATLLSTRQTFHEAMLRQNVTAADPTTVATIAGVQRLALEHGQTMATAKMQALMTVYEQVVSKAAVMSFQDCFLIAGMVCAVGVVPALFLRTRRISPDASARKPAVIE